MTAGASRGHKCRVPGAGIIGGCGHLESNQDPLQKQYKPLTIRPSLQSHMSDFGKIPNHNKPKKYKLNPGEFLLQK